MNKIKQSVKSYLNTSVLPRFGFLVVNRFSEMLNDYTGKKFSYFHRIYSHISEIGGDIVECGVGCGQTLLILSIIAKNDEKHKRNIWGFDSFEGFPEATEEDKRKESLKGGNYHPMQTLEERLKAARIFDANFTGMLYGVESLHSMNMREAMMKKVGRGQERLLMSSLLQIDSSRL